MAMQDPSAPWSWVPDDWNTPDPALAPPPLEVTASEYPLGGGIALPPPPPPPPPPPRDDKARIAAPGVPTQEEVPLGALPPQPLTPEEEAQIQIDQPPSDGLHEPPPLGSPDAVSGGITQEQSDRAAGRTTAEGTTTASPNQTPEDYLTGEELGAEMSKRSSEEQALFLAKIQESKNNFAATRALEESTKARDAAVENARIRDEAIKKAHARTAELDAQAKQLADTDPSSTIPGYKKLFGVLASFIGGFAMNKTGRNVGLEAVDSIAEEAAQQQAQKLGLIKQQRAGVADQVADAESTFHASEAARLATYDTAIKGLESEVQLYDPRGSKAAQVVGLLGDLRSRRAAAAEKYGQQVFENELKAGDLAIKARQQGLAETKFLTEEQRKAAAAMAGTGVPQSADFWEAYSGVRPPMEKATKKEFDEWLATKGKVKTLLKGPNDKSEAQLRKEEAEATKAESEAAAAVHGNEIANPETKTALRQKDGTAFVVADVTERAKLRGITAAAVNIRRLADKIEEVRKKTGGGSKTLGTDDYQELQSLAKAVDFETYKAFDLGAPSAGDQEMAQGIKGGVDITSFLKDPTKGLQTYADSVEAKANTHLGAAGYTGDYVRFRRARDLPKAESNVVDDLTKKITASFAQAPAKPTNPLQEAQAAISEGITGNITKETFGDIEKLGALARGSDKYKAQALESLRQLRDAAVYPAVRQRIDAVLQSLVEPGSIESLPVGAEGQ